MYGIQIATKTAGTYFYVEYRTSSTLGDAALVTWTPISNGGTTGEYGNTVITDCTPSTTTTSYGGFQVLEQRALRPTSIGCIYPSITSPFHSLQCRQVESNEVLNDSFLRAPPFFSIGRRLRARHFN